MTVTIDAIQEITQARGSAISRADLLEIERLSTEMPPEGRFEAMGWVHEGLWLTVADPSYAGDITMSDLGYADDDADDELSV